MARKVLKSKYCIVEDCKNTSVSAPDKLFIYVPKLRRKEWLEAAGRDPQTFSLTSALYCCEDHFDLPNDVENWLEYYMMKCQMRFKEHVVPHIFASQPYWKRAADATDLKVLKRLRTVEPVFIDHGIKAKSSSIVKSDKPILVDKSVQVTPDYRNKSVQCLYTEIKMEEASTSHCGIEFIDVNNDKLLDNSTQTDDDKLSVPNESVNIKTECDEENNQDYASDDGTQEFFIKTEIDIKEEMLDL